MKSKSLLLALGAIATAIAVAPTAQAIVVDLDSPGEGPVTTDLGVIWSQTAVQPTGTGVIEPFLRVDANSSSNGEIREGYNTSEAKGNSPMDDKGGIWTHDVLVSDLAVVNGYFVFLLDANQIGDNSANGARLTLSQFEIFTNNGPADDSFDTKAQLEAAFGPAEYNMRLDTISSNLITGVDIAVQQTHNFPSNNGSGSGDLLVFIPTSQFTNPGTHLILYTEFGAGNYVNNDGFEEWAHLSAPRSVPDGGVTLALLGSALTAIGLARRYFAKV